MGDSQTTTIVGRLFMFYCSFSSFYFFVSIIYGIFLLSFIIQFVFISYKEEKSSLNENFVIILSPKNRITLNKTIDSLLNLYDYLYIFMEEDAFKEEIIHKNKLKRIFSKYIYFKECSPNVRVHKNRNLTIWHFEILQNNIYIDNGFDKKLKKELQNDLLDNDYHVLSLYSNKNLNNENKTKLYEKQNGWGALALIYNCKYIPIIIKVLELNYEQAPYELILRDENIIFYKTTYNYVKHQGKGTTKQGYT